MNKFDYKIISGMPVREYQILNKKVSFIPLKLGKYFSDTDFNKRLERYLSDNAGLTLSEIYDPAYKELVMLYENGFFSLSYNPVNEPAGSDNLAEFLSNCIKENIDWNIFIKKSLKGKSNNMQLEIYNKIRSAAFRIYDDFTNELQRLRIAQDTSIN